MLFSPCEFSQVENKEEEGVLEYKPWYHSMNDYPIDGISHSKKMKFMRKQSNGEEILVPGN
jgi:hypothetical protein